MSRYGLPGMASWMPKRDNYDKEYAAGRLYILVPAEDKKHSKKSILSILSTAPQSLTLTKNGCVADSAHYPEGEYQAYYYICLSKSTFNPGILYVFKSKPLEKGVKLGELELIGIATCEEKGKQYKKYSAIYSHNS